MSQKESYHQTPREEENQKKLETISRRTVAASGFALGGMVSGIIFEGVTGVAAGTACLPLAGTVLGASAGITVALLQERRRLLK